MTSSIIRLDSYLQKQYAALVWISRPFENEDEQKLSLLTDLVIQIIQ